MFRSLTAIACVLSILFSSGCVLMLGKSSEVVTVHSDPSDAEILLDGFKSGRTPAQLKLDKDEDYVLVLRKEGYSDFNETIDSDMSGLMIAAFAGGILLWGIFEFFSFTDMAKWKKLQPTKIRAVLSRDPDAPLAVDDLDLSQLDRLAREWGAISGTAQVCGVSNLMLVEFDQAAREAMERRSPGTDQFLAAVGAFSLAREAARLDASGSQEDCHEAVLQFYDTKPR